ncbi:DNA-binding transcriptional regulator, MarR family [Albimonas donghaensis]|uniref:DNA-binding transcriptional regulator, MarR family n=1 Tax=Albimonas donghaensis TaxID=356660 RepID=A0A1H2VP41_9RHOB|nr:MarR family winged helix-turn-helix transcriptional regulator [Albimonas donghaensis]SDW69744.1 DNA-binding transcriptional regulator, MarR family [Albimonas donghaensis]
MTVQAHIEGLSDQDRAALRKLLAAVGVIRAQDPEMPLQQVALFLEIAIQEGQSLNELQHRIGMANSSTSRGVSSLSTRVVQGREGLGLVSNDPDPNERRRNLHNLTPKGEWLARRCADAVCEARIAAE